MYKFFFRYRGAVLFRFRESEFLQKQQRVLRFLSMTWQNQKVS